MRKFFSFLFLSVLFLSFSSIFASCEWNNTNTNVGTALQWCVPKGSITSDDYTFTWGAREKVIRVTNQIIIAGSILSVGGVVFAAILYIGALGDGEKIKKAKTSLQFAIIGFAVMLLSFPIVNAIINLIYWLG